MPDFPKGGFNDMAKGLAMFIVLVVIATAVVVAAITWGISKARGGDVVEFGPDHIVAETIMLTSPDRNARILLGAVGTETGIWISRQDGDRERISLTVDKDGPKICLFGKDHKSPELMIRRFQGRVFVSAPGPGGDMHELPIEFLLRKFAKTH